jgi:hypothetical protein
MKTEDFRVVVTPEGSYLCCSQESAEKMSKELDNAPIENYELARHFSQFLKIKEGSCIG